MAAHPKHAAEAETEAEYVARRVAEDKNFRQRIKLSIEESKKGKVLTREAAIERLKKRAS